MPTIRLSLPLRCWPLALAALAGCQTTPPAETRPAAPVVVAPTAPPAPASAAAPRPPTLPEEQRRLAALFRGTPVVFTMQAGGTMRVEVPLRFCFDTGRSAVKPALAAVLDRLAQSQHDSASRLQIGASADAPAKPRTASPAASASARSGGPARAALVAGRVASVRDRLVAQGIAADRIAVVDSDVVGVRLLVVAAPAP